MLSPEQLEGLEEVLPAGYPSSGGVVVLKTRKSRSRRGGGRRRFARAKLARRRWSVQAWLWECGG